MNTSRLLTTLFFCALLLLTNRWLTYQEGIDVLKAADTRSYMAIALAAPALPTAPTIESDRLPTNHTARFIVPYLVGTVAHFTGIAHERMFLIATVLFCGIVIFCVHSLLGHISVSDTQYGLLMLLLIANPYMFRYYLAVPAMVNDIVFVAGLAVVLLGLVRVQFWIVVAGMLLAIAGRQNALVILPAVGAWILWGERWQEIPVATRIVRFGLVVAGVVGVYVVIGAIIAPFSVRGMESDALFGFVRWLGAPSNGKGNVFAEYLLRTIICLLFPLTILCAAAVKERFTKRFFADLPREFWLAMLFVAALYGFAFLGGPDLFMSGVTRYVSHALPAMILALAIVMKQREIFTTANDNPLMVLCLSAIIAAASFHHITTFAGSSSDKASYFAVMYSVLAIFAGICTFVAHNKRVGVQQ
jgi:hypothetical protein